MSDGIPSEFLCPISQEIMKDPVALSCGHTFERNNINEWLTNNEDCPVCRTVTDSEPITNWSLKSLIEAHYSQNPSTHANSRPEGPEANPQIQEQKHAYLEGTKDIKCKIQKRDELFNLTIDMPKVETRRPIAMVCVIDVSGSMNSNVGAAEGKKAFTRLDLVKHVLNVVITALDSNDYLSLVTFSAESRLLCGLLKMTDVNKAAAKKHVKDMRDESTTYTFPGIKKAYELINKAPDTHVKQIVLLTDGQDTSGNDMLQRSFDKLAKPNNVQFNTFGFSDDIWSDTLASLAQKGHGIFGFIPDHTMIGTIFLNFLANTFAIFLQNIEIDIGEDFDFVSKKQRKIITLNYNQERNFLIKQKNQSTCTNPKIVVQLKKHDNVIAKFEPEYFVDEKHFDLQLARNKLLEFLFEPLLPKVKSTDYSNSKEIQNLPQFLAEFEQIGENNINYEQLKLSLKFWDKWGSHYIRSFVFSHVFEQSLNFKSPSMKIYENDYFNKIIDDLTDLFCNLKPPEATGFAVGENMPRVTMHGIMNASGGCILNSCLVELDNGSQKPIRSLKQDDILKNGAKVLCNIKSEYKGSLVKIGDLVITPYHPVFYDNKWIFPIDLVTQHGIGHLFTTDEPIHVCNLVLDKLHSVLVAGIQCITLGHGIQNDDVLRHPYYGSERILNDLRKMKGWDFGSIHLKNYNLIRDNNGLVSKIEPLEFDIYEE